MNGHDGDAGGVSSSSTANQQLFKLKHGSNDFNYKNFKLNQSQSSRKTSQNDLNTQLVRKKSFNFTKSISSNKPSDISTTTPSSSSSFNSAAAASNTNNAIKFKHYFQNHLNQEYANSQQQMSNYNRQQQQSIQQHPSNQYDVGVKSKSKSNSLIRIKNDVLASGPNMDSKSSKIHTSSYSTRPRTNLEFNVRNNALPTKSSQSPTPPPTSSVKLRKSLTLNNSNTTKKIYQSENTSVNAVNSMTNVNSSSNSSRKIKTNSSQNDEEPMTQSRFSKPKAIYVNETFDDYHLQNELNSNKLNETIIKSVKRDDAQQHSPGNYSMGGGEKTQSLSSSTSSKIKITSYTLNHQNQIELQQQLKNTNKSINRLAYSKSSSSKNNLGTVNSGSRSKLPVNQTTETNTNGYAKSNVKLCRVIKTGQTTRNSNNENLKNSIFISSASTLYTNNDTPPNEELLLNSIDFIKNSNQTRQNNNINNETFTEHEPFSRRVPSRDSSMKIIDSMASFIDELKDFVDDRLNDTTSQLEMANQRITGLYECFNFVASEFSLLKFQNDELLKELKQYYHTYGVNKLDNNNNNNNDDDSNFYEKRIVKKKHQQKINGKMNKENGKKSSETSSAISSFPIKSHRKSKKTYTNRKNEFSYSSSESSNTEFSSQNVSLKSFQSNQSSSLKYNKHVIVDSRTIDKKMQPKRNEKPNDLKTSLGKRETYNIHHNNDNRSHVKTSLNSSINCYETKNENKSNKSWMEQFDTKQLIANEMRTSSQIDLDLDKKLNALGRNNFVSTELPSDEIYDGNASDRNIFFDENVLNSNELDSNDLASSLENFGEEEDREEVDGIYSTHNEIINENENQSKEELNVNDVQVDIVAKEDVGKTNELNVKQNEIESSPPVIGNLTQIAAPIENGQLTTIIGPKVVHHIHTSIAPFQSTLMNDFDNQYLWDYSDNNKFQKF